MIGKMFGNYKIVERIDVGGMGEVYKAVDTKLSRPAALKFLLREMTQDKTFVRRFIREAQAASALDHPNVCTIYEITETKDGRMYIAMAYYDGKNLRSRLSQGPLPIEDAIFLAAGVADGLDQAHRKGIIHRDIKPANLIVTSEGVAKVVDFGLAKVTGRSELTRSGVTLGTLAYMSPEQTQGKTLDQRTDIFSLGVALYEMLTGENPFLGESDAAVVYKIVNVDPRPPSEIRPGLPTSLDRVLGMALEKHRDKRYRTMADFRDDLVAVLREISPSRTARLRSDRRASRYTTRTRVRLGVAAAAVVGIAILAAVNREWIKNVIVNGPPRVRGVAVLSLIPASEDPADSLFARGMASDLTVRIARLTPFDRNLWFVSRARVEDAVIPEPPAARNALGVNLVFTGAVQKAGSAYGVDLELRDARTMRILDRFRVSTDAASWSADLDKSLIGALGVRVGDDGRGGAAAANTPAPVALGSLVVGRGWLESSGAAAADSALVAFDRAIAADSSFADAYVGRAQAIEAKISRTRDTSLASEGVLSCDRALAIDSLRSDAWATRGRIKSASGDVSGAIEDFDRAVGLNGRDAAARHDLAFAYLRQGEREKSEQVCRAALVANPRFWGGYEDLGYVCYVLGRYDEAVTEFNQVARLAPNHAPTYNYLGAIYYSQDRWEDAIAMFEKSFALKQEYQPCSNLGALYHMMGRFPDAARNYELALEYNRDYLLVGNLASAYYWIPGERARASENFEKAIALARSRLAEAPNDADLLSILAGYYSIDHPDSAVRYAERALARAPSNADVLYRSAVVYETIGSRARALAVLGQAIASGHSMKEIEHEQHLAELRKDDRYQLLVAGKKESKNG
jgi:serine/threonine-protein kinase